MIALALALFALPVSEANTPTNWYVAETEVRTTTDLSPGARLFVGLQDQYVEFGIFSAYTHKPNDACAVGTLTLDY
jgi:hypothetical protein